MDLIRSVHALASVGFPNRGGQEMTQSNRAASGNARQDSRAHDAEPSRENDLSALPTSVDGHVLSAVGLGHQHDCPMDRA